MRLIGTVDNEKKAFTLYSFLLEQGIHSSYDKQYEEDGKKEKVGIWIYEEDEVERALGYLEEFKQNPDDPKFANVQFPQAPPQSPDTIADSRAKGEAKTPDRPWKKRIEIKPKKSKTYPLTYLVILMCVFLYFWNSAEQLKMVKSDGKLALQIGLTSVQQNLMFDYPRSNQAVDALIKDFSLKDVKDLGSLPAQELAQYQAANQIPTWRGFLPKVLGWLKKAPPSKNLDAPKFEKIKQGEIWRLFTPCLLHAGLLHILFNMAWAWLLLKQIEDRLPKWKILALIGFIGVIANLGQYFVSGPYFLGFSGIVCGLVAFIWVRQKVAPWEGYPLQKSTIVFILVFVGAMFVLEIVTLISAAITTKEISANIANTAHIIGGLTGLALGRLNFFSRRAK